MLRGVRFGRALLLLPIIAGLALLVPTSPVLAVDTPASRDAPDLTGVRAKIKSKDWAAAIRDLNGMLAAGVEHADVYNLLGFSLRKSGDYAQAYTYYRKALDFEPNHKGALEYLGELYVERGELGKARQHVRLLRRLCPDGCEELDDLTQAIAQSEGAPKPN
jgi:Flp pilus assembly protein TadD